LKERAGFERAHLQVRHKKLFLALSEAAFRPTSLANDALFDME
jgi:hypothetical protein